MWVHYLSEPLYVSGRCWYCQTGLTETLSCVEVTFGVHWGKSCRYTWEWAQGGIWGEGISSTHRLKHSSAAAHTSWKRCARNQGSWEQLVRCNDRRITLQGRKKRDKTNFGKRKGASLSGSITAKGQKRQIYTSCFKKGVIYPDPKLVCREARSCLYAETSALTKMTFWNVASFSLPLHRW